MGLSSPLPTAWGVLQQRVHLLGPGTCSQLPQAAQQLRWHCCLPGAAGRAAVPLLPPEPLPAAGARRCPSPGLGPFPGHGAGLRGGRALPLGAHARGKCSPCTALQLCLGRALQADRGAAQPEEAGAALLHLHSQHSEPQRTGLQAVGLTQAPACQVQQEHRALAGSTWQREGILLVLPLTVSLLNTLMSHLYNLLAICERQDSPAVEVYVAICRWAAWGRGRGAPSHWLAVGRGPGAGGPPYVGFSPSA